VKQKRTTSSIAHRGEPTQGPTILGLRRLVSVPAIAVAALGLFGALPATAQTIVQQDLVLTEDHVGPLWIFTSGITVDCQNFRVIEPDPVDQEQQSVPGNGRAGILLYLVSDVTVQNCDIEDFWFGIRVIGSTRVNLVGNTVIENTQPAIGWTVRDAFSIEGSNENTLIGNTEADTNGDGFVIVNSSDNLLSGNSAGGGGNAFGLLTAHNNNLQNNTVTGSSGGDGFYIHESHGNRFIANTAADQTNGFKIQTGSTDNTIKANEIRRNTRGIFVCPELRELNSLTPNRFRDNTANIVEGGDVGGCL